MSDDFNFIYSQQFRDRMEHLREQLASNPQFRRSTPFAIEAAQVDRYLTVSEYFKANSPEFSRGVVSALAQSRSGPSQAVARRLVEHLRANPPVQPKLSVPASTLSALSRMVAKNTAVGTHFDTVTIQALFEQVRGRPKEDEEDPPELDGMVVEEFKSIPESDRQTLTPQQARLIKEVIRYLVISTFVCLYLTAQEGSDLSKWAANILGAYRVFDGKVSKIADWMVDWADAPEGEEGAGGVED